MLGLYPGYALISPVPRLPIPSKSVPTVKVYPSADEASLAVANQVAAEVQRLELVGNTAVLGLPTGATPETIYQHWCQFHKERGVNWRKVITFNLDEYWPLPKSSEHSYHYFMEQRLFGPAGFDSRNTFIPSGMIAKAEIDEHCKRYEAAIERVGGIDIQLLGIGINGHLGFNEPGSSHDSITRLVDLSETTRKRAQPGFGATEVPRYGITMGLSTILRSRHVYLLAFGAAKADAVRRALHGPVDIDCPGSFLQQHPNVHWVLDAAAAAQLELA